MLSWLVVRWGIVVLIAWSTVYQQYASRATCKDVEWFFYVYLYTHRRRRVRQHPESRQMAMRTASFATYGEEFVLSAPCGSDYGCKIEGVKSTICIRPLLDPFLESQVSGLKDEFYISFRLGLLYLCIVTVNSSTPVHKKMRICSPFVQVV